MKHKHVLLTRSTYQNQVLQAALTKLNIPCSELPLIKMQVLPEARKRLLDLVNNIEFDQIVFISPAAVEFGADELWATLNQQNILVSAVGKGTADAVRRSHADLEQVLFPETGAGAEALLAQSHMKQVAGQRFLIVTGSQGKPLLEQRLQEKKAEVSIWECYERVLPRRLVQNMQSCMQNPVSHVLLHSGQAATNFVMTFKQLNLQQIKLPILIVGAPAIAEAAIASGWSDEIVIANSPAPVDMLAQLTG